MGLSLKRGPKWEDDSFGYINSEVSELELYNKLLEQILEENFLFMTIKNRHKNLK